MGINIKGSGKKKSQKKETDPKEKLERDLKSCMQCKFFMEITTDALRIRNAQVGLQMNKKPLKKKRKKVNVMDVHMEETVHIVFRA